MNIVKKILTKFSLVVLSFTGSVFVLAVIANIYIIQSKQDLTRVFSEWTLDDTNYSSRYIFWGKSYCEKYPDSCREQEERITTDKMLFVNRNQTNQTCERFLFLGDSFTVAPWTDIADSWMNTFLKDHAVMSGKCVVFMQLATGGSGNDQQLARFTDVVNTLRPDVVIWQFFWNDMHENIVQELFQIDKGTLRRINALKNPKYIAGYMNQKFPALRSSALGKYMMHIAETQLFTPFLSADTNDINTVIAYNSQKITLILSSMEKLATKYGFRYVVTLAPLECQSIPQEKCDEDKEQVQNNIRFILSGRKNYVSMESLAATRSSVLGVQSDPVEMFNNRLDNNSVGGRHLSRSGNIYFGKIFSQNYRASFE